MMRRLRQMDYDAHQLRPADFLALALGYALMLACLVAGVTMLVDWMQGGEQTVLPALMALFETLDGGAR